MIRRLWAASIWAPGAIPASEGALATSEYPARGFIAVVCAAVTVPLVGRIVWLGREYRRRKRKTTQ